MSVAVPESPPPPSPPQRPPGFDFVRPLAFVFDDPRWIPKILLGGVFVLASAVLIGIFFIYGYMARLIRNVIGGVEPALPEWDDLGEFFSEGLRLFAITLIYVAPILLVFLAFIIPTAILQDQSSSDFARNFGGGLVSCVACLMFPIGLAVAIWMPAAILMAVVSQEFSPAFNFSHIAAFIKANVANYLLALVVWLVARFAAGLAGVALLCIGLIFTQFWAMAVGSYALGQVYRLSSVK